MMEIYLEAIQQKLRNHDKVKEDDFLKSKEWKNSSYIRLTKIIHEILVEILTEEQQLKMGTTISHRTLRNIYKGKFNLKYPIDPRMYITISKIVIFLGYQDWNSFTKEIDAKESSSFLELPPQEQIENRLVSGLEAVYKAFFQLPKINLKEIESYFLKQHSAYKEIVEIIMNSQEKNWTLSNEYNPSSYELLDTEIISISKDKAKIKTKEYWVLCWWNPTKQKYVKRVKIISNHLYILQYIDDQWFIKTNASERDLNPNLEEEKKKVEKPVSF